MKFKNEFGTVDLILNSDFETRAIDAFSISLLKVERQIRRIFTFLIYQHPNYNKGDGIKLREILANNRKMYFINFINGINQIYYLGIESIYGDNFQNDFEIIKSYTKDRNKIFHGQLTKKGLDRDELINRISIIQKWCKTLEKNFITEMGFGGFERNAYQKSDSKLTLKNIEKFETLEKFKNFLESLNR
jgi:hypothetical protein